MAIFSGFWTLQTEQNLDAPLDDNAMESTRGVQLAYFARHALSRGLRIATKTLELHGVGDKEWRFGGEEVGFTPRLLSMRTPKLPAF
eukprot:1160727-Pelagomonas_calceolata.AAC.9